jgi:hypothetical protein
VWSWQNCELEERTMSFMLDLTNFITWYRTVVTMRKLCFNPLRLVRAFLAGKCVIFLYRGRILVST